MKPVDVTTEIDIERPVVVVAAFGADPDNASSWYSNIDSVTWRTDPPLSIGSVIGFEARFLGRRIAYDHEIAEHEPGARLVMRTQQGPSPMETTYSVDGPRQRHPHDAAQPRRTERLRRRHRAVDGPGHASRPTARTSPPWRRSSKDTVDDHRIVAYFPHLAIN